VGVTKFEITETSKILILVNYRDLLTENQKSVRNSRTIFLASDNLLLFWWKNFLIVINLFLGKITEESMDTPSMNIKHNLLLYKIWNCFAFSVKSIG